ncbi:MAG: Flp family type IVb pilin [Armatimonadetes bacterium]|nr:Flp family type IVb pilin [Armatimonadota bacterium]
MVEAQIRWKNALWRAAAILRDRRGQGMVEYVLIAALLGLGAVATMTLLKDEVTALFTRLANTLKAYTN